MKDNKLEVGDEIYSMSGYSRETYHVHGKIDRVTKTMAFIGTTKFRRELSAWNDERRCEIIPRQTGYNTRNYMVLNDEVREEIKKQKERDAKENALFEWENNSFRRAVRHLSGDKLSRIAAILGE